MIVEKELLGFTAGNFDLLHPGYIKCFKWAKKHCDKFIIFLQKVHQVLYHTYLYHVI